MIRRHDVQLLFRDSEPTAAVLVRGVAVATLVLPGLELPHPDGYDGSWAVPMHANTEGGPEGGVRDEGEFLLASWRNRPDDGALEEFVRLHKGRWDRGAA